MCMIGRSGILLGVSFLFTALPIRVTISFGAPHFLFLPENSTFFLQSKIFNISNFITIIPYAELCLS